MYDSIKSFFNPLSDSKAILIISIIGILVFSLGLFNGFVGDDNAQIVNNLAIHSVNNILNFFTGAGTFYGGDGQTIGIYFRPVTVSVYSIIYSIFGPNPFGFHLIKLFLYIANASILYLVFKRFFSSHISLFLSLAFLLHPINSETAYYISAIQDNLFFFFGIIGLWLVINHKSEKYIYLSSLFFFLSLLSKETGILFVFSALVYAILFERKIFTKLFWSSASAVVLFALLRISAVSFLAKPLNAPIAQLTFMERIANIPSVIFIYIKNFFFPLNLSSSYQWAYTDFNFGNFLLPLAFILIIIILILIFGIYLYRKKQTNLFKIYILFASILASGLLIHSQIVPLDFTASERWAYVPMVGAFGLFGILITIWSKNKKAKNYLLFISIVILILFASRTFIRGFDWKDNITLATNDIKVTKDSYDLEMRIGVWYLEKGNLKEAQKHMERSVELYPYITNLNNLGVIYTRLGELEKAKNSLLRALSIADYYVTYDNLGSLAVVHGDPEENTEFIKNALRKYPNDYKLWLDLAIIEYKLGMKEEAKIHVANSYALDRSNLTLGLYDLIMKDLLLDVNTITGEVTAKTESSK